MDGGHQKGKKKRGRKLYSDFFGETAFYLGTTVVASRGGTGRSTGKLNTPYFRPADAAWGMHCYYLLIIARSRRIGWISILD